MAPKKNLSELISQAVMATRIAVIRETKDIFKSTERRLYAYPVIKLKIQDDGERIEEIREHGAPGKSKSILKYQRSGARLTPEEISDALIQDITAEIAANEHEIETIDKALDIISGDSYAEIIKYKYFEGKSDDEISESMSCDPSTVRRNKSRLVGKISVFLYGVSAIT